MALPSRLPLTLQSPPDPGTHPPEVDPAKIAAAPYGVVPTACQYCVVGCGYEAHLWTDGLGTDTPPQLEQAHWVSPAMTGQVRYNGMPKTAAVVPDPKCSMNKGNHSPRGGTQGRNLVFSESQSQDESDTTRERIATPYVRTVNGFEPISTEDALHILAELVKEATKWAEHGGRVRFRRPEALGVKIYEYQYLENTFAATKLFFQLIGTPNVAYHDRPSVASNTQGFNDSGIDPHGYAYDDFWDSDVLFVAGNNPYESQSVFFMQYMAGKPIIVLDPRRTISADYAERTGGLHLQPNGLGADSLVLNALARHIRWRQRQDPANWPERVPWNLLATQNQLDKAREYARQVEADPSSPDDGPDRARRARYQLSFEEYERFLDEADSDGRALYSLENASQVSGIPVERLQRAAELLAGPVGNLPAAKDRKVSLIFEKGLIWGYSYQNTAAMANLGLLLGSVLQPGEEDDNKLGVTGRAGGHQKGWAEVRYRVAKEVEGRWTAPWVAGYPFHNAEDEFFDESNGVRFRTHHYFDAHLVGTRVAPRHDRALPSRAEPDIRLLWVIGSNMAGQVGNASAKFAEVSRRRGARLPSSADPAEVLAALRRRIRNRRGLVVVQQDIYPNPTTAYADLILPAAGWGEEDFTRYTGERRLRLYGKFQDPPAYRVNDDRGAERVEDEAMVSRCQPDWRIFQQVAQRLLPGGVIGNGLPEGYSGDYVTRDDFAWGNSAAVFRDLALHSNLKDLIEPLETGSGGNPRGHVLLRQRGTEGYIIPLTPDANDPLQFRERRRTPVKKRWSYKDDGQNVPYGPYAFVRADWREVAKDYEQNRPRDGEFAICNGRVNELWNSLFTHIRNETVRQRWPDDMPGTILEMNPEDAKHFRDGRGRAAELHNGQVVEVRCQGIHLGANKGAFRAVVSLQPNFLPRGVVFAVFSYPVMDRAEGRPIRLGEFPYREFSTVGYVNNVSTGYVDPINPIAAVKYARARIVPTGQTYPGDAPHNYLGPSYRPRNIAPVMNVPSGGAFGQERLNRKMRELIVQKGLMRAFVHQSLVRQASLHNPDELLRRLILDPNLRARFAGFLSSMLWPKTGSNAGHLDRWDGAYLRFVRDQWLPSLGALPPGGTPMNRRTSFDLHIRPMLRQEDRDHMLFAFDLWKYEDVRDNSVAILQRLKATNASLMPPAANGGPWPNEWIALFERWIQEGHPQADSPSPGAAAGLSFDRDIRPLFRNTDVSAMLPFGFDLSKYADVKSHAVPIYNRLADKTMPCDGPWADSQIEKFKRWMDGGMQP